MIGVAVLLDTELGLGAVTGDLLNRDVARGFCVVDRAFDTGGE
jgi:hypothetical protein